MHQSKVWWPWVATLVVLFIGCGSDSASTGPTAVGSVANQLAAAPLTATAPNTIDETSGDAISKAIEPSAVSADPLPTDWTSTAGTVAPFEAAGKGTAALALELPRGQTEVCSGELSLEWKRTDTLEFQLWMQKPTESFGEVQVVLRPDAPGATQVELPSTAIHDKQAGVFHKIVASVESEGLVVGEDAPVRVCIVINAEAGRYVIDDVQFTYPPPLDDSGDVTPSVAEIPISRGLTSFSSGYAGAPTLTTSEPDGVPNTEWLLGPTLKAADWEVSGTEPAAKSAAAKSAAATKAAAMKAAAMKAPAPKAGAAGGPSIATFELDDPDFCTTETLLPTAPFVSSVSPAPNGTTIPYPLCTAAQYAHLINTSSLWSSNFVLMADIDLSTLEPPPSTASVVLNGVFEGNGKTLSNYTIETTVVAAVLGKLGPTGIIRNLTLRDFNVSGVNRVAALVHENLGLIEHVTGINLAASGSTSIGVHLGIAGIAGVNYGTLSDVTASVNISGVTTAASIGGLVGRQGRNSLELEGFMVDCSVSGTVTRLAGDPGADGGAVGGAVSLLEHGSISNTHADVSVTSPLKAVGGLVGSSRGPIVGSSASGPVTSGGHSVGGLVGINTGVLQGSFSTSSVSGTSYVGGLVGLASGASSISDSYATGNVQGTGGAVGGLCGRNSAAISTSYATGTVDGIEMVGGLIGYHRTATASVIQSWATGATSGTDNHVGGLVGLAEGQIDASYARGVVSGANHVGGLAGTVQVDAVLRDCASTASSVNGSGNVGGLIGHLMGVAQRCFATGNITGDTKVGGLVGAQSGSVADSYATGAVTANIAHGGGLVGLLREDAIVLRAYSAGHVAGPAPLGGFVGEVESGTLEDCHFNATENPALNAVGTNPSAPGVTPNTDAALRQEATFGDWDFEDVWGILEDSSFPFLQPVPSCSSGGCGLGCPCPADICSDEADCAFGQTCGEANGGYFDEDPAADLCWDPLCQTRHEQLCGEPGAPCGSCVATEPCDDNSDCSGSGLACESGFCGCPRNGAGLCSTAEPCTESADCEPGLTCGSGVGSRFGVPWDNVCIPPACMTLGPDSPDCGSESAPCGECPPCVGPDCSTVVLYSFNRPPEEHIVAGTIGGSFDVSDGGTATYSIPIALPPGRADMTPQLGLVYDSSGRQEVLGEGWALSGFSYISRCVSPASPPGEELLEPVARRGIRGDADQICLDGQQLARQPALDGDGGVGYTTANESFKRIRAFGGAGSSATYFQVSTPEGQIFTYGSPESDEGSVLLNLLTRERRVWALTRVEDQAGNYITYEYGTKEGGPDSSGSVDPDEACREGSTVCGTTEIWPERIRYTGFEDEAPTRSVQFLYDTEVLGEPITGYLAGVQTTRTRILSRIDISIDDAVVRSYLLENVASTGDVYELRSIWECFPERNDPDDPSSDVHDKCKNPSVFEYAAETGLGPAVDTGVSFEPSPESRPNAQFVVWDANADGRDDLLTAQVAETVPIGRGGQWIQLSSLDPTSGGALLDANELPFRQFRAAISEPNWRETWREYVQGSISDINGDGLDDLFDTSMRGQLGEALAGGSDVGAVITTSLEDFPGRPPLILPDLSYAQYYGLPATTIMLLDIDGDGPADFISNVFDALGNSIEIQWRRGFGDGTFKEFENVSYVARKFFPIDMDGDGTVDLVSQGSDTDEPGTMASWEGAPELPFFEIGRSTRVPFFGKLEDDVILIDVNGDGLKDVLVRRVESHPFDEAMHAPQPVILHTNTGRGLAEGVNVAQMDHSEFQSLRVLDYDGDGREDALMVSDDLEWVLFSGREGRFEVTNLDAGLLTTPGLFPHDPITEDDRLFIFNHPWSAVADLDGDGAGDLVVLDEQSRVQVHYGATALAHMLTAVTDGLGERTELDYHNPRDGDVAYLRDDDTTVRSRSARVLNRVNRPLVRRVRVHSKHGDEDVLERSTEYLSTSARVGYAGHGWLGFDRREVEVFDASGSRMNGVTIEYDLNEQMTGPPVCFDPPCEDVPGPDIEPWRFPFAGLPTLVETRYTGVARPLNAVGSRVGRRQVEYDWTFGRLDGGLVTGRNGFTRLSARRTFEQDVFARVPVTESRVEETFAHDSAGNVTEHDVWSFNGGYRVEHSLASMSYWPADVDRWLLRLPSDVTLARTRGDTVGPEIEDFAGEEVARSVQYDHNDLGQLTEIARGGEELTTTLSRDEYGNVDRLENFGATGITRVTTVDSFDADNIYPEHVTVLPDVAELLEDDDVPLEPHTASFEYDPRYGKPSSQTDTNDLTETWQYDGFGRLVRHDAPDGSGETLVYEATALDDSGVLPVAPVFKTTSLLDGGGETTEEVDSLGRIVRTGTLSIATVDSAGAASHVVVVQELEYDDAGRVARVARPHAAGDDSQGIVSYNYNGVDELISIDYPDGTSDAFDRVEIRALDLDEFDRLQPGPHDFFAVLRTDMYGEVETKLFDISGRLTASIDANDTRVEYSYDGFGKLRLIDGPDGTIEQQFDEVGRLESVDDPDRGFHEFTYTPFDELDTHTRPGVNGDEDRITQRFFYDPFGRLKRLEDADGVRRWEFDQADTGIGRLSAAIVEPGNLASSESRVSYSYDTQGRLEDSTHRIDGADYTIGVDYTEEGRVQFLTYPSVGDSDFRIEHVTDVETGMVQEVRNADDPDNSFWRLQGTYQGYLLASESVGPEVVTTREYFPDSGLPMNITSRVGSDTIQDDRYTFNLNHQLETRESTLDPDSFQSFQYDQLNRVHRVLDAAQEELERIDYELGGNIEFKTGIGDYVYEEPSGIRPHAVTDAGNRSFEYDDSGNQIARIGGPQGDQSLDYSLFGLPYEIVTDGTSGTTITTFEYSPSGTRTVKRRLTPTDPDDPEAPRIEESFRVYVSELYEVRGVCGGASDPDCNDPAKTHVYRVQGGGREVAQVHRTEGAGQTIESEQIYFLHDDQLGSTAVITAGDGTESDAPDVGTVLKRQRYSPFGTPDIEVDEAEVISTGFAGLEEDSEEGVVNMRGRLYDPELGRFVSPDPLTTVAGWSQGLDPYSYALNNPLGYIDPSGFAPNGYVPGNGGSMSLGLGPDVISPKGGLHNADDPSTWSNDYRKRQQATKGRRSQDKERETPGGSGDGAQGPSSGKPHPDAGQPGGAGTGNGTESAQPEHAVADHASDLSRGGATQPARDIQNKPGDSHGLGQGPGSTGWDGFTAAMGILNFTPPSDDGISGGIPGGHCRAGCVSGAGIQTVWNAVTAFGGHVASKARGLWAALRSGFSTASSVAVRALDGAAARVIGAARGAPQAAPGAIFGICFAKGTLVHTSQGLEPIEEVAIGDLVWAWDEATGELSLRRVMRLFETPDQPIVEVELAHEDGGKETIRVTAEHPFWSDDGWTPVNKLEPSDRVLLRSGSWSSVGVLRETGVSETVYNFEVESLHTYYVGEAGALVHNSSSISADLAKTAIAKLPAGLFKPLQCTQCASAMVTALQAQGIRGQVLNIRAAGDFIASDLVRGGTTSITRNGFHQAVQVGDMVFDNFLPGGVAYPTYVQSLHAIGGVTITATPF